MTRSRFQEFFRNHTARLTPWVHGAVVFAFLFAFRNAFAWLGRLITGADVQPLHVVGVALVATVIISFVAHRRSVQYATSRAAVLTLVGALGLDALNTILFQTFILSASAAILAGYALLGFYIPARHWRQGWFLAVAVLLTLPFIEHIQTFLGFPVRVLTASVVSHLMNLMGVDSISRATVILTENNASVVDLPCSGVKSLYTGALFLCGLYFFQRVTMSIRLLLITVVYAFSLLAFNIWRVFSLVYLYDVLGFTDIANRMHVAIGVGGFIASGMLAFWMTSRFLHRPPTHEVARPSASSHRPGIIFVPLLILLAFLAVDTTTSGIRGAALYPPTAGVTEHAPEVIIPGATLHPMVLTDQEKTYFENRDVAFAQKYAGQTNAGTPFTLLLVKSASWRTHHNPEVCLQGMGERIDQTDLIRLADGMTIRKVQLGNDRGTALYWFMGDEGKTVADYSERVWQGLLHPRQPWTLVEIGLGVDVDARQEDIAALIHAIGPALQQTD